MPKITLVRENRTIEVPEGANLREALLKEGVEVYRVPDNVINCRGHGLCGTCLVESSPPEAFTPVTLREKARLWQYGKRPLRLSCQVKVVGDAKVLTRPQLTQGWMEHPYYAHLKEDVESGPAKA